MNLEELMKELKIEKYPKEYFEEIYPASKREYEEKGAKIVDDGYLKELNHKFGLFEIFFDDILAAAKATRKNQKALIFLYLLKHGMSNVERIPGMLENLTLPKFESDILELSPIFSLLPFVSATVDDMEKRGVPSDIIRDTLKGYEISLRATKKSHGKPIINILYLRWIRIFIHGQVLRIGRFNFHIMHSFDPNQIVFANRNNEYAILINNIKIHRSRNFLGSGGFEDEEGSFFADFAETNEYFEGYKVNEKGLVEKVKSRLDKGEWEKALDSGDAFINVHIPGDEVGLEPVLCEESYIRAKEVFTKCYPNFKFKAFACFSWLLDPQLKEILSENSKIVKFQEKYIRFSRVSTGMEMFYFVYRKDYERLSKNFSEMPEGTSLEKAFKKHYLSGKRIYSFGGVFF